MASPCDRANKGALGNRLKTLESPVETYLIPGVVVVT